MEIQLKFFPRQPNAPEISRLRIYPKISIPTCIMAVKSMWGILNSAGQLY